jgi:hypothetical protein
MEWRMDMHTRMDTDKEQITCDAECLKEAPKTFFVYLDSGEIVTVADVRRLKVTDTSIILGRLGQDSIVFARTQVFFAGCEKELPPSLV